MPCRYIEVLVDITKFIKDQTNETIFLHHMGGKFVRMIIDTRKTSKTSKLKGYTNALKKEQFQMRELVNFGKLFRSNPLETRVPKVIFKTHK